LAKPAAQNRGKSALVDGVHCRTALSNGPNRNSGWLEQPQRLEARHAVAADDQVVVDGYAQGAAVTKSGGLAPRLQQALEALLDSVVDHRGQTTVREEAQAQAGPAQAVLEVLDRLREQRGPPANKSTLQDASLQ
jgi:hypothetical protein